MEEGECSEDSSRSASEKEDVDIEETLEELEAAVREENKEENGAILSAIQQELQSKQVHSATPHCSVGVTAEDVSWPCGSGGQRRETRVRPTEEEEEREGGETEDKLPIETLEALGHCDVTRDMLTNPHLRDLLLELDRSPAPQQALRRSMNIPVFAEFAGQCLRVCGLRDNDESLHQLQ